jgi:hypothetical protein
MERMTGAIAYQFAPTAYAREIAAIADLGTLIADIRWERARPQPATRNAAIQAAMRQYAAANYR